jgi:hypothetical protein
VQWSERVGPKLIVQRVGGMKSELQQAYVTIQTDGGVADRPLFFLFSL